MKDIEAKTNNLDESGFLSFGKKLHCKIDAIAPYRLNHGTYSPPNNNGDVAPLVIVGDRNEFSYLQFEMIAFLNELNTKPFAKRVHSELQRFERQLKYRN